MGEVLDDLREAPYLLEHLASLVLPSRQRSDGQPRARDLSPLPIRLEAMDALDVVFAGLWTSEEEWRDELGHHGMLPLEHMVRRNRAGVVIGPRGVHADETMRDADGDTVRVWGRSVVNRLIAMWPDMQRAPRFESWLDEVEVWLVKPLRQWRMDRRDPVPERPRTCPSCGRREVYAFRWGPEVRDVAAECRNAECGERFSQEYRLPIAAAAAKVERSLSTLNRWAAAGEIRVVYMGGRRFVDVSEVRDVAEDMEVRQRGLDRLLGRDFGELLRARREAVGVTAADLSARLVEFGVTLSGPAVSRIERGARSVYPGEASPLAEALGVSLGELLAGIDGGPVGVGVVS